MFEDFVNHDGPCCSGHSMLLKKMISYLLFFALPGSVVVATVVVVVTGGVVDVTGGVVVLCDASCRHVKQQAFLMIESSQSSALQKL